MRASTYVVASTPRSGSSLLAEGLEATGVVGRPSEVFAPAFEQMWSEFWGLPIGYTFSDFLRTALDYGTTPNGVYGLKIHWEHVPVLAARLAIKERPDQVLRALFPGAAFVNIVRRDRRAQALSLFRAMATDEWCRFVTATDPQSDVTTLELDRQAVYGLEEAIEAQQAGWTAYFSEHGITPLTVEYEDLDRDYRVQIGRVLEFLGADGARAADISDPRLQRQSDSLNETWRRMIDAPTPSARP
jgi:LPS sulfotransferase NodH